MTFEDAIRESIRKYYEGESFENYSKASGKAVKYTPEYFDRVEEELLPKAMPKEKIGKTNE
jgi:hypothetical protein